MTKTLTIFLAIIFGSSIIAAAIYFGLQTNSSLPSSPSPTPYSSSVPTSTPSSTSSPIPTPTPTPTPPTWTQDQLRQALSQASGIPADELSFSVGNQQTYQNTILLKGSLSRQGEMGGAGFFAYVDSNGVHVTYVGQGVPECSRVNPYHYPTSWADYCLDSNGQTVKR